MTISAKEFETRRQQAIIDYENKLDTTIFEKACKEIDRLIEQSCDEGLNYVRCWNIRDYEINKAMKTSSFRHNLIKYYGTMGYETNFLHGEYNEYSLTLELPKRSQPKLCAKSNNWFTKLFKGKGK